MTKKTIEIDVFGNPLKIVGLSNTADKSNSVHFKEFYNIYRIICLMSYGSEPLMHHLSQHTSKTTSHVFLYLLELLC